jgi:hypothetical protein
MKKFLLISNFIVLTTVLGLTQETTNTDFGTSSVYLTGGISQITGFFGAEIYDGTSSLDLGFGSITSPINGESATTFGMGVEYLWKTPI